MRTNQEVILRKIESSHNNIPLPKYGGWVYPDSLILGQPFDMQTRGHGMFRTTMVLAIEDVNASLPTVRFTTRNSVYELTYLPVEE